MSDPEFFDLVYVPLEAKGMIAGFISLAATGLLVLLGLYFKIHSTILGKMVLIVNAADFVYILMKPFSLIFHPTADWNCKLVSAISHFALMMSFIWGAFFAHMLYTTVKRCSIDAITVHIKFYNIISLIFSSLLAIGVLISDYVFYSNDAGTCVHRLWVRKFDPSLTFLMLIPTFGLTFLSLMWYLLGAINLKKYDPNMRSIELLPLFMYPAINMISYFPCLITNIMITYAVFPSGFMGYLLMNLFQLHGFFNVLVFSIPMMARRICQKDDQRTETKSRLDTVSELPSIHESLLGL